MSNPRRQRLQPEADAPTGEAPQAPEPVAPLPPLPTPSEPRERTLNYTTGLTEAQRAHFDHVRGRDPSPAENLEELERDTHAGRILKLDIRLAPDEKVAWTEAARAKEMTTSDWIRDVLNAAAREVLTEA